jgi:methylisocitrate lyase
MCARTVWEYFHAGAAGLHIEDQVFPKRCGHLDGKELISTKDMAHKVSIAAETSLKVSEGQFVVCARTDAFGVKGLDECISRSKAYVDAGADMIFPEGLATKEDFAKVAAALRGYGKRGGPFLLANMTEFGKTPYIHADEFGKLGYHCAIYPVSTFRVAMRAAETLLKELRGRGTQQDLISGMQTRKELYQTLQYTPGQEWVFPNPSKKK